MYCNFNQSSKMVFKWPTTGFIYWVTGWFVVAFVSVIRYLWISLWCNCLPWLSWGQNRYFLPLKKVIMNRPLALIKRKQFYVLNMNNVVKSYKIFCSNNFLNFYSYLCIDEEKLNWKGFISKWKVKWIPQLLIVLLLDQDKTHYEK